MDKDAVGITAESVETDSIAARGGEVEGIEASSNRSRASAIPGTLSPWQEHSRHDLHLLPIGPVFIESSSPK